jgi:hypothetical protein
VVPEDLQAPRRSPIRDAQPVSPGRAQVLDVVAGRLTGRLDRQLFLFVAAGEPARTGVVEDGEAGRPLAIRHREEQDRTATRPEHGAEQLDKPRLRETSGPQQ